MRVARKPEQSTLDLSYFKSGELFITQEGHIFMVVSDPIGIDLAQKNYYYAVEIESGVLGTFCKGTKVYSFDAILKEE